MQTSIVSSPPWTLGLVEQQRGMGLDLLVLTLDLKPQQNTVLPYSRGLRILTGTT